MENTVLVHGFCLIITLSASALVEREGHFHPTANSQKARKYPFSAIPIQQIFCTHSHFCFVIVLISVQKTTFLHKGHTKSVMKV